MKRAGYGAGSGSGSPWYGSADPDPYGTYMSRISNTGFMILSENLADQCRQKCAGEFSKKHFLLTFYNCLHVFFLLYVVGLNATLDNILNWISNRCTIQGLEKTKVLHLISVRSADAL